MSTEENVSPELPPIPPMGQQTTPNTSSSVALGEQLVEVMPNTGHHYYFIELDMDLVRSKAKEIANSIPVVCETKNTKWSQLKKSPWIRVKPGMKELFNPYVKLYGVWVAIESNIGTNARGAVYSKAENCEHFPFEGQPSSPYAYESLDQVPAQTETNNIPIPLSFFTKPTANSQVVPQLLLKVNWVTALASQPIDVDLIVDFGNTRTTALLLENLPSDGAHGEQALVKRVKALKFMERGTSYDHANGSGNTIINSWFVTHETNFSDSKQEESKGMEYYHTTNPIKLKKTFLGGLKSDGVSSELVVNAKTKLSPQMFVEASPIVLGKDAVDALGSASNLGGGGRCFLSSPKRYAWDNLLSQNENRLFWTMIRNRWFRNDEIVANPKLEAAVLRLFPANGLDWDKSNPPWNWEPHQVPHSQPISPMYPNGDTLSWMALAIIEQANRQINDTAYWKENYAYVPRRLRSVQVTYPSGWTEPELFAYKSKWQKAVNVFCHSHLENNQKIEIGFPIDEGVASQLPIIFSEIESMGRIGENWISLIGKQGDSPHPSARVMTVDIGGGTTDFAIVEYSDHMIGPGVDLHASLLLKDSSSTAGDQMVKEIIESVLLPKLGEQHRNPDWRITFEDLFKEGLQNQLAREEWKLITRLGLIPMVVNWLEDLTSGKRPRPKHDFGDAEKVQEYLQKFAEEKDVVGIDITEPLDVKAEEIKDAITKTFKNLFNDLAKFASAFEVDFVVICGKPTEIPQVSNMLKDILPISSLRICIANEHRIGSWYPFSTGSKIEDAKTLTAVGVALQRAIGQGMVSGWNLTLINSLVSDYRNSWEVIHQKDECTQILSPQEDENSVTLMNGARIGRRLIQGSKPEYVYVLEWIGDGSKGACPAQFAATFRRKPSTLDYVSEGLELIGVNGATTVGQPIDLNDFALKLCTMESSEYWIDEARFNVDWGDDEDDDWKDF